MQMNDPQSSGRPALRAAGAIIVVLLVVSFGLAFQTVNEGHAKVVKNQGAVTGEVLEPGWHLITPVTESAVGISTRPQTYTMSHAEGEGKKNTDDSVRVLTNDGLHVDVDTTIRYRVTAKDAPRFHEEYRNHKTAETRLIRPTVRSVLRTEGGNIDVTDIYTGAGQTRLKLAVEKALIKETKGSGIHIESVQIRNVRLPKNYAHAIEQKKVKQQKIEEAEYEIQVAKKNKERTIINAEADAKKIRIKGDALRRNPEVLQLRYIEALRENENTVYVTGNSPTAPVLTKDVTENQNATADS